MANDTLNIADPDTFNVDWLRRGKKDVFTALDSLEGDTVGTDINVSLNAIEQLQPNFGLGRSFMDIETDDEGLSMPEFSQEAVDKFAPLIGIGVGELLTRGRPGFPAGLKPGIRAGGAKGLAFMLATRANKWGKDFALEDLGLTAGPAAVVGGVAAYGAWKGAPWLAKTIMNDVKIGFASKAMEVMSLEAGKKAFTTVLEKGAGIGAARKNSIAVANKSANRAMEKITTDTMLVLKERMGKEASDGFDDVTKRLMNPRVTARVGRFLGAHATTLARRLAMSSAAMAIPEPVSTVLGAIGMAWTAWDIFNLAKQMPALHALIFEDTPEESVEDAFIDEATALDSLFHSEEQRPIP